MMPNCLPLTVLAQITVRLTPAEFRLELLKISAAIVLLFLGTVAIAFFFARKPSRELTLIYFGLFSILYGTRLLAGLRILHASLHQSEVFWRYTVWLITCVIILPFELFLYQISAGRLRRFFRWMISMQAVLSLVLILLTVASLDIDKLSRLNSASVLVTLVAGPGYFLIGGLKDVGQQWTRELRIFVTGFATWLLFILFENLVGLQLLRGPEVEFLGFLFFVSCLAYITASRSFAKEELLVTINKELDIARQIQSSTLPREVPRVPRLEIAARYVPMSAVAGDFYDFLVVDEHRLGILVADVTGHGVPAALIASMLKVAFAGQSQNAKDPAKVLTGLNRALCGKFEDHFVTAVYVFVDPEGGVMRYAGAGHPPLLLASSSNGVRPVEENGLMLGLFPEATYSSAEITFREGDRCLLYTDGLFEATNPAREEFGKDRIGEFLKARRGLPATELASELLSEISRWAGHTAGRRQEDDITLLVLAFQK